MVCNISRHCRLRQSTFVYCISIQFNDCTVLEKCRRLPAVELNERGRVRQPYTTGRNKIRSIENTIIHVRINYYSRLFFVRVCVLRGSCRDEIAKQASDRSKR